jgi:limonene-1,2-epoxide hydrolase
MTELTSEATQEQHDRHAADSVAVVERFLDRLRVTDSDGAAALLAIDVEYENKGLPTVHGRERVRRLFQALNRVGTGFDVYVHAISADGSSVLTERTDVLQWGRLRIQFWVCGRFDIHDGQIAVWRDYFDHLNFLAATARGLLGAVIPAARAKPPSMVGPPTSHRHG